MVCLAVCVSWFQLCRSCTLTLSYRADGVRVLGSKTLLCSLTALPPTHTHTHTHLPSRLLLSSPCVICRLHTYTAYLSGTLSASVQACVRVCICVRACMHVRQRVKETANTRDHVWGVLWKLGSVHAENTLLESERLRRVYERARHCLPNVAPRQSLCLSPTVYSWQQSPELEWTGLT